MTDSSPPRPAGGLICPVVTPLTREGRLNAPVLARHLDALTQYVDGVLVLGSSGEHPWLPAEVAREAVAVAGEHVHGRAALYVGVGLADVARTARAVEEQAEGPADYLVITPPTYFPLSDVELTEGLLTVAERSPLPIVLYNIPQFTVNALPPTVVRELAGSPAIVGLKDSSGDLALLSQTLRTRPSGFFVLQGRDHLIAPSLSLGADGAVAALSNVAAPLLRDLLRAGAEGDQARLSALQNETDELAAILAGGLVPSLKAAMELRGLPVGAPWPPARPVSSEHRDRIAKILDVFDARGHLLPRF